RSPRCRYCGEPSRRACHAPSVSDCPGGQRMILRGIHLEHWCCIAKLDLEDLPAGVVVLHGPNRTGKSSLVKAVRGCLYDFDHDSSKAELKSCFPWNGAGPPKVAVEFETGGTVYRLTKLFSKKAEGV